MSKKKRNRRGKAAVEGRKRKVTGEKVRYKCAECGVEEDIPRSAIEIIDILDEGLGMPEFKCKECKGIMTVIDGEGINGIVHIVSEGSSFKDDDDLWF